MTFGLPAPFEIALLHRAQRASMTTSPISFSPINSPRVSTVPLPSRLPGRGRVKRAISARDDVEIDGLRKTHRFFEPRSTGGQALRRCLSAAQLRITVMPTRAQRAATPSASKCS